ncbi:MAG: hypothetical protein PHP02_01255 [Eubacteriales bacterium]|nr:hypothetical protein [Eubacteriales bacterium]
MLASITRRTILLLCVVSLMLANVPALAQGHEGAIKMVTEEAPGGRVTYPRLTGFENTFVQDSVNQAVLDLGGVQGHLDALAAFSSAIPGNLSVSSTAAILPSAEGQGVFSVLVEAQGNLGFGPPSHRYMPLVFDLTTGQPVSCGDLFLDCDQARASIEEMLKERLDQELSNYLDMGDLFPFPLERFLLTENGISFFYPEQSMVWLSGKSAYIHFLYHELEGLLRLAEGDVLSRLSLQNDIKITDISRAAIDVAANLGALPGLPVSLGDGLSQVLETYPLLYDPEGFVAGEKYQLEDDRFRGTIVISGDGREVTGLLSRRMNLFGLITGKTSMDEIMSVLGEPAGTFPLNLEAAGLYGVPAGAMLAYHYPNATLQLFVDDNNVLSAVWLDQKKAE